MLNALSKFWSRSGDEYFETTISDEKAWRPLVQVMFTVQHTQNCVENYGISWVHHCYAEVYISGPES